MTLALLAIAAGLAALIWSADRFVTGSAAAARQLGMPPLLIGMLVVGFGTSAPELAVSALAAVDGNPGLALGNAFGSNIQNIALILGIAALVSPIAVRSRVLRTELPVLLAATALAGWLLRDGMVSRGDAVVLLATFGLLMAWTLRRGRRGAPDALGEQVEHGLPEQAMPLRRAILRMATGLLVLLASSRALVWGAVEVAQGAGVSDVVIGLTVVAVGTSLPELASSLLAARRGEHEIALGNVIGSNLFNTLAVVGLAGAIRPLPAGPELLGRDLPVMAALTLSVFLLGFGFRGRPGRISRGEGAVLVAAGLAYTVYLLATASR